MQSRWSGPFMLTTLVLSLLAFGTASADWSRDYHQQTLQSTDNGAWSSLYQQSIEGGPGELITTWQNENGGDTLLAQKLSYDGNRMWGSYGTVVLEDGEYADYPCIAPDGNGGMYLAWSQPENGNTLLHLQHYDANCNPTWAEGGVVMQQFVILGTVQWEAQVVADGAGGAIVAWIQDGDNNDRVFAQRFNADGEKQWSTNTLASLSSNNIQGLALHAGTYTGQSCLAWAQHNADTGWDIVGQYISETGLASWDQEGLMNLSWASGDQMDPQVVSFGGEGLIAAWADLDSSGNPRVEVQGKYSSGWPESYYVDGYHEAQEDFHLKAGFRRDAYLVFKDVPEDDADGGRVAVTRFDPNVASSIWGSHGVTLHENERTRFENTGLLPTADGGVTCLWKEQYSNRIVTRKVSLHGEVLGEEAGALIAIANPVLGTELEMVSDDAGGFMASWMKFGFDDFGTYPVAVKVDLHGYRGNNGFTLTAAQDRPNDQGGEMIVTWDASPLDNSIFGAVENYSVWVMGQDKTAALEAPLQDSELAGILGMEESAVAQLRSTGFVYASSVPAVFAAEYSAFCPTFGDSTGSGVPSTLVKVIAHHQESTIFWDSSNQISGHSVDNLAPGAPLSLAGVNNGGAADLTWVASGSHDEDLAQYLVYRGSESGFVLDETTLVGSSLTPGLVDNTASGTVYYRVTAVDAHGNEGLASGEVMVQLAVSAVDGMPTVFHHRGNYPNPFNPMTQIAFDLPRTAGVRVSVYDAGGRLVTTLISETLGAGHHEVRWNGQDSGGRSVSSGVYFSRVEAGEFTATRSMTLVR
jgi:hypothetical protein|nr:FlgD immunoglobulin-like domain containing protein [Candidatus Krumholzibacteria bacterium]